MDGINKYIYVLIIKLIIEQRNKTKIDRQSYIKRFYFFIYI